MIVRLTSSTALLAVILAVALPAQVSKSYAADFEALLKDIDKNYPFFDVKGIRSDWGETKKALLERVKRAKSDAEFIGIVQDAIGALRDGHAFFTEVKPKLDRHAPEYQPGLAFLAATEGRVIVMATAKKLAAELPIGAVVLTIDGKPARKFLDDRGATAWKKGGAFSSPQRATFFEYRIPLRGPKGTKYVLEIETEKAKKRKVEVLADVAVDGWPHTFNEPSGLKAAAKSVYHAELEGGCAYVYLRRIDETAAVGLAAAIAAHPEAKSWIVDLRGNSGGGYDDSLLKAVEGMKGPVAAILDAGCISAGETFARDLKKIVKAKLLGSTTAGSSTQKKTFALPSGIAVVQYSVKSRFGPDNVPIEFNGVKPDVEVEVVPEEARAGKDSAIERARELLAKP